MLLAPCVFYLVVDFARPMGWVPGLATAGLGLIAGAWGLVAIVLSSRRAIPRPILYMFGILLLMAVHVPLAVNNRWALWGFQDFAVVLFGGVLPLAVLPRGLASVRKLLYVYVLCHVPPAIYGLTHAGFGPGGWMEDENDLALALNVGVGMAIYLLIEARTLMTRLLMSATTVLLLSAIVSTRSRGGFVGLVVLGLFLLIVGPHRKFIATCVVVAVLVLLLVAPAAYWDEVRSITTASAKGDTGETRLYFWGIGWRMFLDHPIIGVGTNNYGIRAPEYQDPYRVAWRSHTWGRVAHSMYFTLLPELGLVGTVLFCATLVWSFRVWRRLRRLARRAPDDPHLRTGALAASGLAAGIVGTLITGAFLSVLYYPVLWILVALLAALDASVGETIERQQAEAPDAA